MKISRAAIKYNARGLLTQTKPSPLLIGLLYLAISIVLTLLSFSVTGWLRVYAKLIEQLMAGGLAAVPGPPAVTLPGYLINLALTLMMSTLSAGFTSYCLNICQQRPAGAGDLFDGFTIFFKLLWLNILTYIFASLWMLLFIVPGIIALYRYRMALYIMLENPHMGACACIRASGKMMRGHKWGLFVFDLSFLGWLLLLLLFPFAAIWVTPYISVAGTNYYLALRDMPRPDYGASPRR
jgi:uncharacterized membrane protein